MVVSRSDSKRRKKEVDSLQESPKRTKVHAQRKFAQGSHLNSPVLTPVKDKDKAKYNGAAPTAELLPIKRPKTEQFVNFLCFRGSDMLPKSLEFFNEPSISEPLGGEEDKRDGASTSGGTSRGGHRSSDKHGDQAGGVAKAEARNKNKSKSMAAVQALKKKYQEQRMNKEKRTLTKLALKVKGKNMMRTRSAGPLEEKPAASSANTKKAVRTSRLVTSMKTKAAPATRKPVLRKHPAVVKRLPSKSVTRGGLRSGGGLPPGSDEGIKTERKPRKFIKVKAAPLKKSVKKAAVASSLSDFSSDDEQPLVKKQRVMSKASILASRVSTRSRLSTKPSTSQSTSSRPPRKTKEAATLFMEMLKKDLRSPDEEEDNVETMFVDSYGDSPKRSERRGSKDSTDTVKIEKKSQTKSVKKETKPNENKLLVRNNKKLPDKPPSRLSCLKTRTLRRNSYRLVAKEIELKKLKNTRAKLLNRMSPRSSSKETTHDNSCEVEKINHKRLSSDRDTRRDRRSNTSKIPESKSKQQKPVTKESDPSPSKVSKKKSLEATFDDSDEEPLGKKVNQNNSSSASKALKKSKPTSDKEEAAIKAEVVEQKITRRRSLNTTHEMKEEARQLVQSTVKAHQTAKSNLSDVGNENNGKMKTEATVKPKAGDKSSNSINPKSKQIEESANETNTNATQKPKENEKNNIQNKIQTEKKGKKPVAKCNENENSNKAPEDKSNIPSDKKQQANKSIKTPDTKKTTDTKVGSGDLNNTSKQITKVTEPKRTLENVTKNESSVKSSKENLGKCNSIGKNPPKKNSIISGKGTGNTKSKNEPTLSNTSDNSDASNTGNSACVKLLQPKKVNLKKTDQMTQPKEKSLDFNSDVGKCKSELGVESTPKTVLTKKDTVSDENMLSSPRNPEITIKKPSIFEQSISNDSQISEVNSIVKNQLTNEFVENLSSSPSFGDAGPSNHYIGKADDVSILGGTISSTNTKEVVSISTCSSTMPQDEHLENSSNNGSQNLVLPSSFKVRISEKAKENPQLTPNVVHPVDSAIKSNKTMLLGSSNEENLNVSSNLVIGLKGKTEDQKSLVNILPQDSRNKVRVTGPCLNSSSQMIDSNVNEVSSCPKSVAVVNEQNAAPNTSFLGSLPSFTSIPISNKCVLESIRLGNTRPKDEPDEIYSAQLTQPAKHQLSNQQFLPKNTMSSDDKLKIRNVVLEPTLSKNLVSEAKLLPVTIHSDLKGKIPEQLGVREIKVQTQVKADGSKLGTKEEKCIDNTSKLGSLDMSDKVSSAIETLMSLKNVHKIDEKRFAIQSGVWNVKSGQTYDLENKNLKEAEVKRPIENEQKRLDGLDNKKTKTKDGEIKRVTIQEPEFKRSNPAESELRRYNAQEHKPKPEHPQVLKGCSNPKSMLKPGTLIDIEGISHSPEIMTPLRPGVDGEIIPMNRPIRPFGQDIVDPFKASMQGFKPYEPRVEHSAFGYRWQSPSNEKNLKSDQSPEKEVADSKSKTSVNESAWRLAFKNVKDPKSSNNVPTEKPAVKKQLTVTALTKKHKSKTDIVSDKNIQPQSSTSIPFLRQNKPFLGPSPTKTKDSASSGTDMKKSSAEVDPASLREKEAEVEEFLRQCGEYSRSLAPSVPHVTPVKGSDDICRSGNIKAPYLPSHNDPSHSEELSTLHSEKMLGNQHFSSESRYTPKKLTSHLDQLESGPFSNDNGKRASSPLKLDKRQFQSGTTSTELILINKNATVGNVQHDQLTNKQTPSVGFTKQDQSLNIFQNDSVRRSNSPKSLGQKSIFLETDTKTKLDDSTLHSISNPSPVSGELPGFLVGTQQTSSAKQPLPEKVRHFSPNRSGSGVAPDNIFRDSSLVRRTKSPTLIDSYSQQTSSPKGNSISRNTNSPVFGKCSTTNIFKEIVPAKRSYSPTLLSSSQSDSDTLPNVFSQNQKFRRSVSPLSNRSGGFSKLGTNNDGNTETNKKPRIVEERKVEVGSEDNTKNTNVNSSTIYPVEQQTNSPALNVTPHTSQSLQSNKVGINESLIVKEEVTELDEVKNSNSVVRGDSDLSKQDIKLIVQAGNEEQSPSPLDIDCGNINTGMSQAKHRLPLPVEPILKKLGQTRSPQNKKSLLPQKVKLSDQNVKNILTQNEDISGQDDTAVNLKDTQSSTVPKLGTGIYSHNQEGELDLMQKKKVNMSAEEIKRWLNESSTSEVEHQANCGILENNTCECEYRNTLTSGFHSIDPLKYETVPNNENTSLNKSMQNQFDMVETTKKTPNSSVTMPTAEVFEVENSYSVKAKEEKIVIKEVKNEDLISTEQTFVSNQEVQKNVPPNKNTASKQLKEEGLPPISNFCTPISTGTSTSTNTKLPTTPPVSKLRTFRLPNKNVEPEQKPTTSSDTLDIAIPARDDASSSNDLSSSNEETPEKSHNERKSIFHQRRSALKVKERRELLAPSVNAFSPENESSVYAFDPELPPTSTPFRRSKGKDGKSASTTTDDEELTPSSNSIAVQVNFDNEAVLECSTQTDVQEGDDDDTHTFYIPLQQSAADTSKPPLIQGVAVKVDTEGPDQKVIMRAKLVTKPLSTFNQTSSSQRSLIGTRSGKPEQKVRPLSVKPPVGTVQPTARPKPKPPAQDEQPGPSKASASCSPQAARLAKRIKSKAAVPSTSAESHPAKVAPAKLVEAPTFYPTEKEFEDPLEYISSITPQAEKYGLCRVVPPSNFKPECKVSDDMRFTAYNQYIHKMLHRWGPNVKEMLAIKKYLATQSIALTHPPWIGGMEVDLPRLYQTVQQCGGLKEVIEKKRWHRVADAMKIPKSAQDRVTKLDDIYCKFLLPYDTLSHVGEPSCLREWNETG